MRVPESALRFCQAFFGLKESEKPSVTRVELKEAPEASHAAKVDVSAGDGEPIWAHSSLEEMLAYKAGLGTATES